MNGNVRNKLFETEDQIVYIYDSTAYKPGAEECEVINVFDKKTLQLKPRRWAGAPTYLANYAVAAFYGATYIIGGVLVNREPSHDVVKVAGNYFSKCAKLPFPLYDVATAASEDYLVVFGGRTGLKNSKKLVVLDSSMKTRVFPEEEENVVFDLHAKNYLGEWPSARSYASMTFLDGKFYLFGGCGSAPSRELFYLELRKTSNGIKPVWLNLTRNIGPAPQTNAVFVAYAKALWLFDHDGAVWRWRGEWTQRGTCKKIAGKGWFFDGEVIWYEGGAFYVGCW